MTEKEIHLQLGKYSQPGLYLDFHDGTRLELTLENLNRITQDYWSDPGKIPQNVKSAVEFRRCKHCGLKGRGTFCNALRPILPLMEVIDNYNSFDSTTALYKGNDENLFFVSDTTMQRALNYVSNLSLISYCQVGKKFRKYFFGIMPLMETEEIANNLYLNIYWMSQGDPKTVDEVISSLYEEITRSSQNQLTRLRLISKNDAFINAFILTHLLANMLHENRDSSLKTKLAEYEQR